MTNYKQLNSILRVYNKNYLVDIEQWGGKRLSGNDLTQFNSDFDEINAYFMQALADGNIVNLPKITETFDTSIGQLSVVIGYQYSMKDNFSKHPKLIYWQNIMSQDPDITYYPEEIIS